MLGPIASNLATWAASSIDTPTIGFLALCVCVVSLTPSPANERLRKTRLAAPHTCDQALFLPGWASAAMREEISCILRIWRRLITLPRRTPDVWHADEARARARGDDGGAAAAPDPRAPRDGPRRVPARRVSVFEPRPSPAPALRAEAGPARGDPRALRPRRAQAPRERAADGGRRERAPRVGRVRLSPPAGVVARGLRGRRVRVPAVLPRLQRREQQPRALRDGRPPVRGLPGGARAVPARRPRAEGRGRHARRRRRARGPAGPTHLRRLVVFRVEIPRGASADRHATVVRAASTEIAARPRTSGGPTATAAAATSWTRGPCCPGCSRRGRRRARRTSPSRRTSSTPAAAWCARVASTPRATAGPTRACRPSRRPRALASARPRGIGARESRPLDAWFVG